MWFDMVFDTVLINKDDHWDNTGIYPLVICKKANWKIWKMAIEIIDSPFTPSKS